MRRIEHSAPVYEVAISRAAATGRFARGQSAAKEASEEELAREELVLVTGKSSLRTALPPGQASASSARARTGAKESFKVVVYNTHSQSTTSKVGKLRHPRQCCSLLELNGSEYVVFANKSRLNLWSAKALTTDTIANAAIGTITSLATNATKEIVEFKTAQDGRRRLGGAGRREAPRGAGRQAMGSGASGCGAGRRGGQAEAGPRGKDAICGGLGVGGG